MNSDKLWLVYALSEILDISYFGIWLKIKSKGVSLYDEIFNPTPISSQLHSQYPESASQGAANSVLPGASGGSFLYYTNFKEYFNQSS